MLGLALLASAAMTALPVKAEPKISPDKWIVAADFPRSEWGRATATTFDLAIDEAGRPAGCTIVIESGSPRVDGIVCQVIVKRARFRPAKDVSGLPVASIRRTA